MATNLCTRVTSSWVAAWCVCAAVAAGCRHDPPSPPDPAAHAAATTTSVATRACPSYIQCNAQWTSCRCAFTARGDVAVMEADFDGDGRPNLRMTYVYDAAGSLLRWENDLGADGSVDMPCTFEPPCPPPHPNAACSCGGRARDVSREYVEERLRKAGNAAEPVDPAQAQRLLDAVEARRQASDVH